MADNTAVTTAARNAPTVEEIEQIRQGGKMVVQKQKELNKIFTQLEGIQWGNVSGGSFSKGTRMALAEIIYITRANPQLHIDVLGGKPYLNAQYWTDLANSHDHFLGYELLNLDLGHIEVLRQQALEVEEEARKLQAEDADGFADDIRKLRHEGLRLKAEARDAERKRLHFGVPDFALAAYEVVVRRYRPNAPIDQIVAGDVNGEPFIQEIREANWAPNSPKDPIGKDHPHNTARTRTLRRGFVKSFSAWMEPLERDIDRLEKAIEAEYTIIRSDDRLEQASLPSSTGAQAARAGGGEPSAANPEGAREMPVEDETGGGPDFDVKDARKAYFATLRDAGIAEDKRKAWQVGNDLGASTKNWGEAEYGRAMELLIAPTREKFEIGCQAIGAQPTEVFNQQLGREPQTLKEWQQLAAHVSGMVDAEEAEEDGQGRLV